MSEPDFTINTLSVCPVCLARIPAKRVGRAGEVYLEKTCPKHGFFRTILWRGAPDYLAWGRVKIPNYPAHPFTSVELGCPFDCGLCPDHRQQPCCVLLEVTQRCDLGCPVCFASSEVGAGKDTPMETIDKWYRAMLDAGGPFNIQLSGGEPCVRDDLPQIIRLGREHGFTYFQVNTNGLRIGSDMDYLEQLKDAGLQVVYLQFDGTHDAVYQTIRGKKLLAQKLQAIENCRRLELGVVLVPTIVPGVNDSEIGRIVEFALAQYPAVRGIHYQPVSYFGRYPRTPQDEDRITIPEIIRGLADQTNGLVRVTDFQPKGSENAYCSFHATFIIMPGGTLEPVKTRADAGCSCKEPESAREGVMRSREFVARNWVYPQPPQQEKSCCSSSLGKWDDILERARTHQFSISGMAFQDAWNLDLELLRDCCINVAGNNGGLIPFCSYNLTSALGKAVYRPEVK